MGVNGGNLAAPESPNIYYCLKRFAEFMIGTIAVDIGI